MTPGFIFRLILAWAIFNGVADAAETFRVATYNLENYLDQPTETRPHTKAPEAKAKIRESIRALNPDIIALEEMGTTNALLELRASLKSDGVDFPYWDHVSGEDTNIHVAILSRFPIVARHPQTHDSFLLDGRRHFVSRGFAEIEIQPAPGFSVTLIAAHLKSRRPVPDADEAELRFQEAKVLREIVDDHLKADPFARLIVLGDFNDVQSSASTKEVVGRGKYRLMDTRPAERNGDNVPNVNPHFEPRNINWTHYYGIEDSYSRIDYILLSPAMARYWVKEDTYVATVP
ncbi:MAG TPA: endonuclease/exonuclease/phosphatase family protein, partial [Desulfuromonadaceae bacterium]|nr:endonuclease/exonuclease/phosphatase family protein [Desulfuromonadaceae bacterium]